MQLLTERHFAFVAPYSRRALVLAALFVIAGCASGVDNTPGVATRDVNPALRGPVAGVGIESQDITSMSDRMMRDMLQSAILANAAHPPQIIIDAQYITNESSQQIDRNMITDTLRNSLNNAARGRMIFVSRESVDMVQDERALKRSGTVDVGTAGLTRGPAGADYRLRGRITSLDGIDRTTGQSQRLTQIIFEMVDMERDTIVWSGMYKIERAAADDVIYR